MPASVNVFGCKTLWQTASLKAHNLQQWNHWSISQGRLLFFFPPYKFFETLASCWHTILNVSRAGVNNTSTYWQKMTAGATFLRNLYRLENTSYNFELSWFDKNDQKPLLKFSICRS